MPYVDDDFMRLISAAYAETSALLLGRVTYELFAGYWPHAPADDPMAMQMNSVAKYVVSTTLDEVTWNNSHLIKGNVPEELARLKQLPGAGNITVVGSSKVAQTLARHNLVDEYALWVHPVILGSGKRLFENGIPRTGLKLVDTQSTGSGVVILTYRPESPA
jgi:dihydrofolate reductase